LDGSCKADFGRRALLRIYRTDFRGLYQRYVDTFCFDAIAVGGLVKSLRDSFPRIASDNKALVLVSRNLTLKIPSLADPNLSQEDKDRIAIALQQGENTAVYETHKKDITTIYLLR
jgi:hypothetical protein